jgi:uncharacterized damage-inducible protein DinB
MSPGEARVLIEYNCWANQLVCGSAGALTSDEFVRHMGSSYGSVRTTLVHILWAEWLWLQRWQGLPATEMFGPEKFASQRQIDARWAPIYERQRTIIAGASEEWLRQRVAYQNFKGETWEYTRSDMLRHVVNHSTYHRGQVVAHLRQLGRVPPATDFLVYLDENPANAAGDEGL